MTHYRLDHRVLSATTSLYVFVAFLMFAGGSLTAQTFAPIPPLAFTKPFGAANPLAQTITVQSTGSPINFTASAATSSGGSWLTVTGGGCGSNCATSPHILYANVNADVALAAGTYTGQIVVIASGGASAQTIPVTLTVAPVNTAFLDNFQGAASFFYTMGGTSDPPAQRISVRNGGTGSLTWTLSTTTADGGNWLTASVASGTAPSFVDVSVSKAAIPNGGLVAGTFIGQLLFQTTGSSVTVPVSFVVGTNIFKQINPISFTKPYSGENPLQQTLSVADTSATLNIDFSAFSGTGTGGDWLNVTGGGCGYNCATTPHAMTAAVDANITLAAGTYTGQIVITSSSGAMAITVPVYLTVAAPGSTFLDNFPGQMTFAIQTGSLTDPPAQTVQVRNGGTGTLPWTLRTTTADGGNWLHVSATSGTAPSLVTVSVTKSALPDSGGLLGGTFVGELVFETAGSSVTVPVSYALDQSVFRQINPLNFTKVFAGPDPLNQTIEVASTDANISLSAYSQTATGGEWLTLSGGGCGYHCGTAPFTFSVQITALPTLPAGTYTGQVVITSSSGSPSITVPVNLTVNSPDATYFDNVAGQMSFSIVTAGGDPAPQSVPIRKVGPGALNWTLNAITSDGGNWLSASTPSGTAPSTVTVSVSTAALPNAGLIAGTFTGQLIFQSSTGSFTIPVSVRVSTTVFDQIPAVTFTKPFGGPNPVSQILNLTSSGSAISFSAYGQSARGGDFLSLTGGGCGYNCATTPHVFTAAITAPANLAVGTYSAQTVFTETNGSYSMTVPVNFTVLDEGPTLMSLVQGSNQTALPNSAFPVALKVQVTNLGGPLSGIPVTFSVPNVGPSGSFASSGSTAVVNTDSNGFAMAPSLTANGILGSYAATASVSTSSGNASAAFALSNTTPSCSVSTNPGSVTVDSNGGPVTLSITSASSSCTYGIVSNAAWITPASPTVTGTSNITLSIDSYSSGTADRIASIVIGSQTIAITQRFTAQLFTDVPPGIYYFNAVNLLKDRSITSGCGPSLYCPGTLVTRDQMAVFVVRIVFNGNDNFSYNPVPYFTDVPSTAFGFKWIQKMYELGITSGCGPALYCPQSQVTRAQMGVFIIRARYGTATPFTFPATAFFDDVPNGAFGFNWIQRMRVDNITAGCSPTQYCPDNPVIRGDMAIFIMTGGFNQLLPASKPVVASVTPGTIAANSSATFTVNARNTHFVQGSTAVVPVQGLTVSNLTVISPSQFTVTLTAGATPSAQPAAMYVQTGPEEAVLPNAIFEQ